MPIIVCGEVTLSASKLEAKIDQLIKDQEFLRKWQELCNTNSPVLYVVSLNGTLEEAKDAEENLLKYSTNKKLEGFEYIIVLFHPWISATVLESSFKEKERLSNENEILIRMLKENGF